MSIAKRALRGWLMAPAVACALLTGCSDDEAEGPFLDASTSTDAGNVSVDGGIDAAAPIVGSDGATGAGDAGLSGLVEKVIRAQVSATGHDRFYGVTYDRAGNIYAVGHTSEGTANSADFALVVAKFSPEGVLDTGFGSAGFAKHNVAPGGQNVENARAIVIQQDGTADARIVILGEADHAVPAAGVDGGVLARDTDMVLVRFTMGGQLDTSFGNGGVVRHDLGTGVEVASTPADGGMPTYSVGGADSTWSLGQTSDGKLVVHGASRAVGTLPDGGARTDTDYTLLRLLADGSLDPSFAGTGIVRTDVGEANAGARTATVLSDDSILGVGYTSSRALGTTTNSQQPVLYKVTKSGAPDPTFATMDPLSAPGVFHGFTRPDMANAEAYGAALQGSKLVTVGYGPTPSGGLGADWVFFRFHGDGSQDKSFGTSGATFIDAARYGDNGRALVVLPDERILAVGGGRPAPSTPPPMGQQPTNVDAMITVLAPDGRPDTSFGPGGFRLYHWGDSDFFWGAALAPSKKQVAVVGIAGGAGQDDGVLMLLTVP